MNSKQWSVLGGGFLLLSLLLIKLAGSCIGFDGDILIACSIRKYAYAIPAMILAALGVLFWINSYLEKKK